MHSYPWPTDDGWPYPDSGAEEADRSGEVDDDVLSIRLGRAHLLDGLTPLERDVVAARFGLDGAPARSMREMRDSMGLPRADVREALGIGLGQAPDVAQQLAAAWSQAGCNCTPFPLPSNAAMWMSIEVLDGAHSADRWADAFGDSLITSALGHGVMDWSWHRQSFGVVLELLWADEADWERFRASALVQAALDAVPDPVTGLIVYKGRGGSAGRSDPRRIRPLSGSGAAALPLPEILFEIEEPEERRVLVGALR